MVIICDNDRMIRSIPGSSLWMTARFGVVAVPPLARRLSFVCHDFWVDCRLSDQITNNKYIHISSNINSFMVLSYAIPMFSLPFPASITHLKPASSQFPTWVLLHPTQEGQSQLPLLTLLTAADQGVEADDLQLLRLEECTPQLNRDLNKNGPWSKEFEGGWVETKQYSRETWDPIFWWMNHHLTG